MCVGKPLSPTHTSISSQGFRISHTFTSKALLVTEREQYLLLKHKSERHKIFFF